MHRIIAIPVAFLLIVLVIAAPFLGFSFVLPGHEGQWFSWIRKPNFEQMFINCVNHNWRLRYLEMRTSEMPKIRKKAEQARDRRRLQFKAKLEREALEKKQELEREALARKFEGKTDESKQSQKTWNEFLAKNPELAKTINKIEAQQKKMEEDLILYPMRQYQTYLSVTEKIKNMDDDHIYCAYFVKTGRANYKFSDQSYFGGRIIDLHDFAKDRKTEKIASSSGRTKISIDKYFEAYRGKSTFRKYIFGETRAYWADVIAKAGKNLSNNKN